MEAASVSFGKDSTAMVLRMVEEKMPLDAVVFYDTGMEFDAVYRVRDAVVPVLEAHGVRYVELHPKRPFLYDMLERPVCHTDRPMTHGYGWCGGVCRWGTSAKTAAIDSWRRKNGVKGSSVGIAADEVRRPRRKEFSYPLIEWGMSEADCLRYCTDRGIRWVQDGVDLYSVLDRCSCWCCRNKNKRELRAIRDNLPSVWRRLVELEERIGEPMKDVWLGDI